MVPGHLRQRRIVVCGNMDVLWDQVLYMADIGGDYKVPDWDPQSSW